MSYDRKDSVYERARAEGYRARSAIKLRELDQKYRILKRGDRVIDLGCWPGAWLQIAAERVGETGRVVGVDLAETAPLNLANVATFVGDVRDEQTLGTLAAQLAGPADVVLCDIAPKLTGIRAKDEANTEQLAVAVLNALPALLSPGGRLLMKLFMSQSYPAILKRLKGSFTQIRTTRAESTRRGSAELYVLADGWKNGTCG